eukprot:gene5741-7928_t
MSININNETSIDETRKTFTIAPCSGIDSSFTDLLDLEAIFSESYFPPDLDFSNYFSYEENESNINELEYLLSNRSSQIDLEKMNQQTTSNPNNDKVPNNVENDDHNNKPQYMKSVKLESVTKSTESGGTILIPPLMPRITLLPKNSLAKSTAKKGIPSLKAELKAQKAEEAKINKKRIRKPAAVDLDDAELDDDDDDDDTQDLTMAQKIERRERNREHAKRSRIRKRVLLDSLQDQLLLLREYNVKLRRIVAERIPQLASTILTTCTTEESMLLADANNTDISFQSADNGSIANNENQDSTSKLSFRPSALTSAISTVGSSFNQSIYPPGPILQQRAKILMEPDYRLIQALVTSQQNFVLSDPSLPDNPIVYASDGFCKLSGYKRSEILGRNCRFLQGPGTDQAAVSIIRDGVRDGRDISVCLLNYKADGSPFWNQFFVGALRDAEGGIVNYVGVQCEVNTIPVLEIKERVKKLHIPNDLQWT